MNRPVTYQRFVIVSHLRSGTHLLRTSLESHPAIACQTEVFNSDSPRLPYPLATPTEEILSQWVYTALPPQIRCAGFVLQAYHPWGLAAFPGIRTNPGWADIWPILSAMDDIRVIHLRRNNLLRRHLSHVLARATGTWHAWDGARLQGVTHLACPPRQAPSLRRPKVALDAKRLAQDFRETERLHRAVDRRFRHHRLHCLSYENLCENYEDACDRLQVFLGVPQIPLQAAVFKLEERPLAQSISNYDHLKRQFAGTRWGGFFED